MADNETHWAPLLHQLLERMVNNDERLVTQADAIRAAVEGIRAGNDPESVALRPPREIKGPDVETFDGTNTLTLRSWCNQLAIKFAAEPRRFPDGSSRVLYAGQRLRGTPADWFAAAIGPNGMFWTTYGHVPSYEVFTEELHLMYGDPNQRKEARRTMEKMVQGTGRVATYTANFRIQQQIAGDSDEKVVDWYYRGLSREIKDILAQARDVWESMTDLVRQAGNIDERRLEREHEVKMERSGYTGGNASGGYRSAPPARNEAGKGEKKDALTGATVAPAASGGDVVMQDVAAVRAEQRRKGECYACGKYGHLARDCPGN